MSSRATEDILDQLHAMTAQTYLDTLRKYANGEVKNDDGIAEPAPAAFLSGASRFLKDNGVDRAVRPGDPLDLLNDEMPHFEEDEDGTVVSIRKS